MRWRAYGAMIMPLIGEDVRTPTLRQLGLRLL